MIHLSWARQPALAPGLPGGHTLGGPVASLGRWAQSPRKAYPGPVGQG